MSPDAVGRRQFIQYLCGSPLLLAAPALRAQGVALQQRFAASGQASIAEVATLISAAQEAVNVFDFEPVAQQRLTPGHWAFLSTGVDDELTLRANRDGFQRFYLKARRLRDVSRIDVTTSLLGARLDSPIVVAPAGGLKALHAEGERAVAHAARTHGNLMMLSTTASTSIEDAMAARGAPVWFQLYPTDSWIVTQALLKRAERAGCPVVALTVDSPGNRERVVRFHRDSNPVCTACHQPGLVGTIRRMPMFEGIDVSQAHMPGNPAMNWDFVKRVQDATRMQLVIKGLTTAEDAALAVENRVAAIHVSNHGGRTEESNHSTIEVLPDIARAVGGRIPIIVDSGFRRGTDILKGLALGASAVAIGRPYLWGLAAFGQAGVEQVLRLLQAELTMAMSQCGLPSLAAINGDAVARVIP